MLATEGEVESKDTFFKFMAVWMAFNALYATKHNDQQSETGQIRGYSNEYEARDRHRELVRYDDKYREAVDVLRERGVYDPREEKYRQIRNTNNLWQVLRCAYQVRCNLFHGGKSTINQRDEDLVRAGYEIVSKLIANDPYLKRI